MFIVIPPRIDSSGVHEWSPLCRVSRPGTRPEGPIPDTWRRQACKQARPAPEWPDMNGIMKGLLGAALAAVLSCGPGKDDAMRLKEGANLDDISECPTLLCTDVTAPFCTELLFEYGRSPPLCVDPDDICERLDCVEAGRRCVLFEGIPIQLRCIKD